MYVYSRVQFNKNTLNQIAVIEWSRTLEVKKMNYVYCNRRGKEDKYWGGRLLGKTEAADSKAIFKQRPLKKRPSSVTRFGWSLMCSLASHRLSVNIFCKEKRC